MAEFGPSLGDHEVVVSVFAEHVRSLGAGTPGAVPEVVDWAGSPGSEVEGVLLDVVAAGRAAVCGCDVDGAVVVPEDIWVDAGDGEEEGIGPGGVVVGVCGGEEKALNV